MSFRISVVDGGRKNIFHINAPLRPMALPWRASLLTHIHLLLYSMMGVKDLNIILYNNLWCVVETNSLTRILGVSWLLKELTLELNTSVTCIIQSRKTEFNTDYNFSLNFLFTCQFLSC